MLSAAMEEGVLVLRAYLHQMGFVRLYKFVVTSRLYDANPNVLGRWGLARIVDLDAFVSGDSAPLGLAACLMLGTSLPRAALPAPEQRISDRLVDAGLLVRSGGDLAMGPYQLISVRDMPLLIDRRINFPGPTPPQVYLGSDSLRLVSYVDTSELAPTSRAIDLGTGSGVIGLFLARYSDHVTMTDVSPQALELAHANRLLAGRTGGAAIREERCEDTLRRGERYRVVTFNPPFLPVPDGLDAPVYARGLGRDGLGYCRMLLEDPGRILEPDGTAYLAANLLGGADGPYFADELHRYADRRGLQIELFIESSSELAAGAPMFEALGALLHRSNPAVAPQECRRRMEELQLHTLGATRAYLGVLVVRRARDGRSPSLRVYHWRTGTPSQPAGASPWTSSSS